jgi:hypothetical protein
MDSYWNHRVIRSEDAGGVCYAIHEVFYEDGKAGSWTETPVEVISETRTGLFCVLARMTEAVGRPILEVQEGKLVEVEPRRELTDDLKKAIAHNKEYAEGMV